MSENSLVYSIQHTYIIKPVSKSEKRILTCDERIDVPTIDPLSQVKTVLSPDQPATFVPCIELAGEFLSEFNLTFETNEGVTVLPIKIASGQDDPLGNPYRHFRYVLALPSGATGVKSCKLIHKVTGKEVQHNFTFGIMPPPYNYDNALFGFIMSDVSVLDSRIENLILRTKSPAFGSADLPKGAGKQTINIEDGVLFYATYFSYPSSGEPKTHRPKITLHGGGWDQVFTLSLNKTETFVSIDLFTGMIRVCDANGEIIQQFMLSIPYQGFETLSFENFDDIGPAFLIVGKRGAHVIYV